MKTILVRCAILIATCGWAASAHCAPVFVSVFGGLAALKADVFDPALTLNNSQHAGLSISPPDDPKGVAETKTLGASVGSNNAVSDISFRAKPGLLSVFASASASATNTQGNQNLNSVAGASTFSGAYMKDEWGFHASHKVRKAHVVASFKLASDLTTRASGVNGTPASGFHDAVEADARAFLTIFGTGIPTGPYTSHGSPNTWGFFEDAVLTATINPHIRDTPPKIVPVEFDIEGESQIVTWVIQADAQSTVSARDVINHESGLAIGISDTSHTLTWGGIASITDVDTGELITDYTLTSASGFDYVHAFVAEPVSVPEPPSLWLLAPCLAAGWGSHRYGRSAHQGSRIGNQE